MTSTLVPETASTRDPIGGADVANQGMYENQQHVCGPRCTHTRQRLGPTMGLFSFLNKRKMPSTLEAAMASQAADFVRAFSKPGAPIDGALLDYSRGSLELVDRVLQDFFQQKAPLPDDLHFLASAYAFEVARRAFGGRYLRSDEDNPFVLVIGPTDAEVGVCFMGKVRGRALNGPEDSLIFFYDGIAPLVARGVSATLI
ncbi:hypothetical protein [Variovorax sp. LG9.2]|uniref:hypothetical protein n=1 Tax=Variovorax sp. LG9.2 TaxID=3048626 RepID=UPI002B23EB52|nr:hypothetical protein [Variovorax sp. LG9.2]MEB0059320.1 hypothetical protein [Variovorax sp. LG9.2]